MAKLFALVNGLSKLFNTIVNDLNETTYDVSHVKDGVYVTYNVNQNTLFYILVDQNDKDLGYNGTYIYTNNTLFSSYDNKGGQFVASNIINSEANEPTVFLFGAILPNKKTISPGLEENMPWALSYHLQSYSPSNSTFNSEFDVFLYGNGHNVYSYYAFNANNTNIPFCYHVIKEDQTTGTCKVGVCLYDTKDNNTLSRNIGFIVNNYTNCQFSNIDPLETDTLDGCIVIDATQQGFVEQNNNTQLKIPNIHINKISTSVLKNLPRLLYGFDRNGNIAPLISVNSLIPYASLDYRNYNTIGFDYTRGLFYSNNYDGSLTYVEGNLYSSYAGMDYRYFDNVVEFDVTKPIYITGIIRADGLFQIQTNNIVGGYPCAWTLDLVNDPNVYYWFVGYPQNTPEKYLVNLFENNKVYHVVDNELVEYSKTIEFTPTGTISIPLFYGLEATISVSGQCDGVNSSSNVTIIGSTDSVNNVTNVGELPTITIITETETANFNQGKLPEVSEKQVWVGYSEAVADAQLFTGATVTFTGSYTPIGTISQPIFYGNKITITT